MSKKRKFEKRIVAVFMIVVISAISWMVVPKADGVLTEGDYQYQNHLNGTVEIVKYLGTNSKVAIPKELGGKKVIKIGAYSFRSCYDIKELVIPENIEEISELAFEGGKTNLEKIMVSEDNNFYYSEGNCVISKNGVLVIGCKNSVIPKDVNTIGYEAFESCPLTEIDIPNSVVCIENNAFWCSDLVEVNIPEGVKRIGSGAFKECTNLNKVTLPNSLNTIGAVAFDYCVNLEQIELPENVEEIGEGAFMSCSCLQEVKIPKAVTQINDSMFWGCEWLLNVSLPDNVTSIGDSAFGNCRNLLKINIPKECTSIGKKAFYKCDELSIVEIPEGVMNIGEQAFYDCWLYAISLPSSLNNIGDKAIDKHTSICAQDNSYAASWAALNENKLIDNIKYQQDGYEYILDADNCAVITNYINTEKKLEIPAILGGNKLKGISNGAFYKCNSVTEIKIPEGVSFIGVGTFYKCSLLQKVVFPESLSSIGMRAFSGCINLNEIEIPGNVKSIECYVFEKCKGLTKVKILEGVRDMAGSAFRECTELKEITLPYSVTVIDGFEECNNLEIVHAKADSLAARWAERNGYNLIIDDADPSPTEPTKPDTTTQQPQETQTTQQQSTTEAAPTTATAPTTEVSPSMAEVGTTLEVANADCKVRVTSASQENPTVEYVAAKNKKVLEIQIPDSVTINGITYKVTAVAKNAFSGNKKVKKVVIGKNVTSFGKNAFANCKNLKTIVVKTTKLTKKSIAKNVLKGTNKKLTIKVPKNKLAAYKKYFKGKGNKTVRVKKA